MMKRISVNVIVFLFLIICAHAAIAQVANGSKPAVAIVAWKDILKQKPEWYASDEAVRIADNVLLYQHDTGGWSKNIDMARALTEQEKAGILKQKPQTDSNIDNGATYTQLTYLARVYAGRKLDRHKTAFLKGVDYLLEAQQAVRFLMGINQPDERVTKAIESAIAWFEKSKLTGIKWEEKPDSSKPRGYDRVVVKDPNAGPIWARFYEIETNRPIFIGRDSRIKYDVAEIEEERRNGYSWYVDEPNKLLSKEYPAWQKKLRPSS